MDRSKYLEYLRSAQWQDRRAALIRRNPGAKCYCCDAPHSPIKPLDLHHLTYARLGNEWAEDLVTVCRECHDLIHGFLRHKSLRDATERVRLIRQAAEARKWAPTKARLPQPPPPVSQPPGPQPSLIPDHPDRRRSEKNRNAPHPNDKTAQRHAAFKLAKREAAARPPIPRTSRHKPPLMPSPADYRAADILENANRKKKSRGNFVCVIKGVGEGRAGMPRNLKGPAS